MDENILSVENVSKQYGRGSRAVEVLRNISVQIKKGETLGVVGESGSGKSTLAKLIVGLEKPSSGSISIKGRLVSSPGSNGTTQLVFQDPASSLNPLINIKKSVEEPLTSTKQSANISPADRVADVLQEVGVSQELMMNSPSRLSGGQKQRVSIARALADFPELIVCDEAVTALDVSIRAQVLNLLRKVQSEHDNSMLFISHDLSTVAYMSDRVLVLYLGTVMEIAPIDKLLKTPGHPYSFMLLSAVPTIQQGAYVREKINVVGEQPSLYKPPNGCRFSNRCPIATELCNRVEPELRETQSGQFVACHFAHQIGQLKKTGVSK